MDPTSAPALSADRLAAVRSREELRFAYVDEQGWDASCGYAALATLLHRYRGLAIDEEGLLARGAPGGGEAVVKVTLGQLVALATDLGLTVRPWRTTFDRLGSLLERSSPLLVHYDRPQGHFALVLFVGAQGLVTADPARGLELLTRGQFEARWSGVAVEVFEPQKAGAGAETVEKAVRTVLGRTNVVDRALSHPPGVR